MDLEDIRAAQKSLAAAIDSAKDGKENVREMQEVLDRLKEVKATADLLKESRIGITVGKLRTHKDKTISTRAQDLVKLWKAQVGAAGGGGGEEGKGKTIKDAKPVTKNGSSGTASPTPGSMPRTGKSDGVDFEVLGEKTRNTCLGLIYDALVSDSTAPTELVLSRALAIEEATHDANGSANNSYRTKMRSLYLNLKDVKNPSLRSSIVSGELPARKLATMSSADMASGERKAADEQIELANLFKARGAGNQAAETDAFRCGKCGKRKCTYYQMQTRSADEPMTTFVTCVECNNRWRFC